MLKNKDGKIINIGSIAGQNGGIFAGDLYSVSKASIINITKSIAKSMVNKISIVIVSTQDH